MANPLSRLLRRDSLRDNVRRAIESGIGLYHTTWSVDRDATPERLSDDVIAWCRDTLGQVQRPYGLDHVTLAVSVLSAESRVIHSENYGVLRPIDFYGDGAAQEKVGDTLETWAQEGLPDGARLSAVLFSWGDLTRELLPAG